MFGDWFSWGYLIKIKETFSWIIHRFHIFEKVQSFYDYTPNPPRIDTLFDEKNNFLQLLLKQLKNKNLIINDSVQVIASNSDAILKELKDNGTDQIKLLLKNEIYNNYQNIHQLY